MRFIPGCCSCSGPCCFSVKVTGCAVRPGVPVGLSGVSITLTEQGSGTVVMDGITNSLGMVANTGGTVIRVCPSGTKTYDLAWDYAAGNTSRMILSIQPPGTTNIVFNGSGPCPIGDSVFFIAVTPAN